MWWSLWSFLGGATVSACSGPADPRTLPQLTRRNVERGIDWAVNDASLEAGIRVAKGYRGGHDTVAAEYASAVVSAAKRQLDLSLAILVRWSSVSRRCNQCLSIPSEQCRDEVDAAGSCMAGMQGCRLEAGAKHELDRHPVLIYQISRQPIHANPEKKHGTKCYRLGKPQMCEYRTHRATGAPLRPGSNHVGAYGAAPFVI